MGRRTSRAVRRTSRNARRTTRGKQRRVTHKSVKRLIKLARQQGWDVEFTAKGHLRFVPADRSQEIVIAGGTPSDWRAAKNLEAQLRKSGLKMNRRTSRGLRRNSIPPPAWSPDSPRNMQRYLHWVYTTYADGTPVMFKVSGVGWAHGQMVDIRAGAKAIMAPWDEEVPFEATAEVIPGGYQYPQGAYVTLDLRETAIEDILEPLEDNWKLKPGRPISRHMLATSQRSWFKPNVALGAMSVPPPADEDADSWRQWLATTFAPGTPVKVSRAWLYDNYMRQGPILPKGARAVVIEDPDSPRRGGGGWSVAVEIVDARDEMGYPLPVVGKRGWVFVDAEDGRWYGLEPLEDNWRSSAQGRRTSRHALPRSQRSWMKPNIALSQLRVPEPDRSQTSVRDYFSWMGVTFAPGTPVRIVRSDAYLRSAPRGARAVVTRLKGVGNVYVRFTDARDETGLPLPHLIGAEGVSHEPYLQLEPLEDNWIEALRSRATARHRLPRQQRSWLKPNADIDELGIEVGDTVELERHPIYDHPGEPPSYKVTRRKVKDIRVTRDGTPVLTFVGMRMKYGSSYMDKRFRLSGSKESGWELWSGKPGPTRYAILSVIKK